MSKIGVVTVYGESNFGNKLQNYGVIKVFQEYGYEVETLRVYQSALIEEPVETAKELAKWCVSLLPLKTKYKNIKKRERKFKEFSKKYLCVSEKKYTRDANVINYDDYVLLSVGSDQVWNDHDFNLDDVKYYTLSHAKNSVKMAFSASIGKNSFSEKYEQLFKDNLNEFAFISCREISGAEYLKGLVDKEVSVWLDPVFFIDKKEWLKIATKPNWLKQNDTYSLIYCLGGARDYREKYIGQNTKTINLLNMNEEYYATSPEEFVYLVNNANLIVTDSFHACAFAIMFGKDFIVLRRLDESNDNAMMSRIESLFEYFGINKTYGDIITKKDYVNFDTIRVRSIEQFKLQLNTVIRNLKE